MCYPLAFPSSLWHLSRGVGSLPLGSKAQSSVCTSQAILTDYIYRDQSACNTTLVIHTCQFLHHDHSDRPQCRAYVPQDVYETLGSTVHPCFFYAVKKFSSVNWNGGQGDCSCKFWTDYSGCVSVMIFWKTLRNICLFWSSVFASLCERSVTST